MRYRIRLISNGAELDSFAICAGEGDLGREAITRAVKHHIDPVTGWLLDAGDRIEITTDSD